MSQSETVLVNATVFYAFNDRVNQMSGKYQIDLGELSVPAQQALEDLGLDVKHKEKQGPFITCKSKFPIRLYNTDGEEITAPVGNGSKVVAKVGYYEYKTPQGQTGRSPKLLTNKVTDLVIYEEGEGGALSDDLDEAL